MENKTNPLLEKLRLPGETVQLPSQGIFYKNTDVLAPDVVNGEVHVYPMTGYEEILMNSPDKLFSGDAVREVFKRCVPQVNNVDQLLAKDVDFLLLALRKVSYGDTFEVTYKHTCENGEEHTYTGTISEFLQNVKPINEILKKLKLNVSTNQVVKLKPISFSDFIRIVQEIDLNVNKENTENPDVVFKRIVESVVAVIESVDDITDKDLIREWIENCPPSVIKEINDGVDATLDWGIDPVLKTKCKDCGEDIEISTLINPLHFFT